MLGGWAALCPPTQSVQQLLMEVWELQYSTALDPETHSRTKRQSDRRFKAEEGNAVLALLGKNIHITLSAYCNSCDLSNKKRTSPPPLGSYWLFYKCRCSFTAPVQWRTPEAKDQPQQTFTVFQSKSPLPSFLAHKLD